MNKILIKDVNIVNEGEITQGDVLIKGDRIDKIANTIDAKANIIIRGAGKYLIPGIIDDQVHFREPGLTHKADIYTESKAGIAGGITSFMEMPNTKPPAVTQELLEEKYFIGSKKAQANYSFFMGTTNDNIREVLKTDPSNVCGVKIFMGSSTGNMLVDDLKTLEKVFSECPMLIATHCEDEATIRRNTEEYVKKYGEDIPISAHPDIRSAEACVLSSSSAIELAKKHNTRLHILHISTKEETEFFRNDIPLEDKRITSEVCVHHMYFNSLDYETKGTAIKCNPAIKGIEHQQALLTALLDDRLDIIATDHAPHSWSEKDNKYLQAPSGLPLIQHSLNIMLEMYDRGIISLERIVQKMCHNPAICFKVKERGFIREGYYADLVVIDLNTEWKVLKDNIYYKCAWSPLEGHTFKGKVAQTIVNGKLVYNQGQFLETNAGERLEFDC